MPPIPKFAKALAKLAKANPKIIEQGETYKKNTNDKPEKAKLKPIASAKTSEITPEEKQTREGLIREKLEAWGKANEPPEGWYFEGTNDKLKEIKLRRKYLKEKPKMLWLNYLGKNGLMVERKVTGAKDDLELRKQSVKQKFIKDEPSLVAVIEKSNSKKRAKDTSDLLSMMKKFQKIDARKLNGDEIYYCIEDIKEFFKTVKAKLGNSDPISRPLDVMIKSLNVPECVDENTEVPPNIVSEIINSKKQIYKLATERGDINEMVATD